MTKEEQSFFNHLWKSISEQKKFAFTESYLTSSILKDDLKSIEDWFSFLNLLIKKDPPKYYVRCLEINEDKTGMISHIHYCYYDKNEKIDKTSIIIAADLY